MPRVSIIVPCYNEQDTIRLLLDAIYQQSFPQAEMEVIIADGMSTDQTRSEIQRFQQASPDLAIILVDNPKRIIPAGLNRALEAAQGEFVIRLDAHSMPSSEYVARCVAGLEAGKGENVGGVWEIRPGGPGWMAKAIALAASHPLGVGDARYRYSTQAGRVETVPFGAFRREIFSKIGFFNENLLTNEDYELNTRLSQSGGRIWFDPTIRSVYFARPGLRQLASQYWRYGYWKWRMLRNYLSTLRWRQALPPIFLLSLVGLGLSALWWSPARILLALEIIFYIGILVAFSMPAANKHKDARLLIGLPAAIMTMHICWSAGFWVSMLQSIGLHRGKRI